MILSSGHTDSTASDPAGATYAADREAFPGPQPRGFCRHKTEAMSGEQGGDPAKLARALVTVVDQEQPPLRWVAGADAVATVEQKANGLLAQIDPYRELSSSLAVDERELADAAT